MGSIALSVPQVGQPNSTEGPKIASDFNVIQTLVNGSLDTNNLSPTAAILRSQLAIGTGFVKVMPKTANYPAVDGDMVMAYGSSATTITLPAPVLGTTIGVWTENNTATTPVTVASAGGLSNIRGMGAIGVSSILLGAQGSSVLLVADGGNWYMIAGQQDTGWIPLSLNPSLGVGSGYTPSVRLQGDTVRLKGVPAATGSIAGSSTLVAIPAGLRPSVILRPVVGINQTPTVVAINPSGALTTTTSLVTNDTISLDGVTFSIS